MGFISKLLGGLFTLIGSLFSSVTKLLGLGKKSEYFLEADAAKGGVPNDAKPQPQTATAEATPAANVPVPPPSETTKIEVPATSASLNGKVEVATDALEAAPQKPAPVPAEPAIKTFAPNFLVGTTPARRRRPGPSLNPFLDMAKEMKTQG